MIDYKYDGFEPYGAGDYFCIDQYIDPGFSGNAIQQLLSEGCTIEQDKQFPGDYVLLFPDGELVATLARR